MSVRIRAAGVPDIRAVADFQTAAWNEAYRELVPADYLLRMTVEARVARWDDRIRRADREVYLAERDGEILGVVSFGVRSDDRDGPPIELMSLYIAASEQRTGLGTKLLDLALDGGPGVLWVFAANLAAIEFYRRRGFDLDLDHYRFTDQDTGLDIVRMIRLPTGWVDR